MLCRMVLCKPPHTALTYSAIPLAVSTLQNTVHLKVFLSNAGTGITEARCWVVPVPCMMPVFFAGSHRHFTGPPTAFK